MVSVCQEEVFYEYLAKLLAWALYLEVPVISFYHNENGTDQQLSVRRETYAFFNNPLGPGLDEIGGGAMALVLGRAAPVTLFF